VTTNTHPSQRDLPLSPSDPLGFKQAMAQFASGVTVVTTRTQDRTPIGITASSFTSLSLDPHLVLVCVANSALSYRAFIDSTSFGVSMLAADQADVAQRYAKVGGKKFTSDDHFMGAATGTPLIVGAIAHVECQTHQAIPAGDHAILIGRVCHLGSHPAPPLVSFDRRFGTFQVHE
jgi:flavin reductase (DIM6/NTAB) family NADH-FMN oxidoreductase RutF